MAQLDDAEIRARIKQARLEAGLSQTKMAELLGVIPRSVQNYENHHVPWARLRDIAEITGASTRWLLHGEEVGPAGDVLAAITQLEVKLEQLQAMLTEPAGAARAAAALGARAVEAAGSTQPPARGRPARRAAAQQRKSA